MMRAFLRLGLAIVLSAALAWLIPVGLLVAERAGLPPSVPGRTSKSVGWAGRCVDAYIQWPVPLLEPYAPTPKYVGSLGPVPLAWSFWANGAVLVPFVFVLLGLWAQRRAPRSAPAPAT